MSKTARATQTFSTLDELARRDSPVHRRHPAAHLLVTLLYVVLAASYGKYELSALLPLSLYPLVVMMEGDIPPVFLFKRAALALPFVLFIGLFNPLLDPRAIAVGGVLLSAGWLSLASILLRSLLTVTAALLLIALTGLAGLSAGLKALRLPSALVMQLVLTYRYIHVLAQEAGRILLAYRLRAPMERGIAPAQWGPLAGQWLLRTLGRAQRLHQAMLCRGFDGTWPMAAPAFTVIDGLYILGWSVFFVAARVYNLPALLGALLIP